MFLLTIHRVEALWVVLTTSMLFTFICKYSMISMFVQNSLCCIMGKFIVFTSEIKEKSEIHCVSEKKRSFTECQSLNGWTSSNYLIRCSTLLVAEIKSKLFWYIVTISFDTRLATKSQIELTRIPFAYFQIYFLSFTVLLFLEHRNIPMR